MISLFRNSCKKFNFIHQTVSPWEAHLGWTQNLTKGSSLPTVAGFHIYITLTHAVATFHFDPCINNINFNSTVIPAGLCFQWPRLCMLYFLQERFGFLPQAVTLNKLDIPRH